jgi:hypothetical protein
MPGMLAFLLGVAFVNAGLRYVRRIAKAGGSRSRGLAGVMVLGVLIPLFSGSILGALVPADVQHAIQQRQMLHKKGNELLPLQDPAAKVKP